MKKRKKRRASIFLLPSFFTTVNLFFGYLSIISILKGNYKLAAIWIVSAAIIDAIDGILARLTKTTSDFGLQFDSLADAISFGIAPCLLLYYWGFSKLSNFAWTFPFIYLVAGILRLARFNIYQGKYNEKKYSIGLSIPSASLMISALVLFHPLPINNQNSLIILCFLVLILSFLMISKLKYLSYKSMNLRKKKDLKTVLIIGVIFVLSYIFIIVLKHTQLFIIDSILDSARHIYLGDKSPDYIQGWNDCIDYIYHRLYTNVTGGV